LHFCKARYGDGNLEKPHVGDGKKKKFSKALLPRVTVQSAAGTAARMPGPQQVLVIQVSEEIPSEFSQNLLVFSKHIYQCPA